MPISEESEKSKPQRFSQGPLRQLLADQEELLETILGPAADAILICDTQGQIVFANAMAKGLAIQDPQGTTFDDLLSTWGTAYDQDGSPILPTEWSLPKALRGEVTVDREARLRCPDGRYYDVLIGAAPLKDRQQQIIGAVATFIDVTKSKQAEERQRHFLARLLDSVEQAVIATDLAGAIIYWNRFAEEMYGWTAAEVMGRNIIELLMPRAAQVERVEIMDRWYRGESQVNEFLLRRRDGTHFPAAVTGSPILDEQGQLIGRVGLSKDITQRKQVEEEKARLFEAVNQQREQLRALTARLAEVQEAERQALAHELHDQVGRNLTALGLNLNIIWSQLAETSAGTGLVQTRLDDSLALVEQITESIRDVMADLHPPVLDDYGLVAALRWYGIRFASRVGFNITVQGEEPAPRLSSPVENALFRIAQEALTNVAKHAQASQVTLTVEAGKEIVRLTIADNGIGFEPAASGKLPGQPGWGRLIMRERASVVGGRCWIESAPGQGTRVIVEMTHL